MIAEEDLVVAMILLITSHCGTLAKTDGCLVKRGLHWLPNLATVIYFIAAVLMMLAAQVGVPARAQEPVETLIAQIFGTKDAAAYELQAHARGMFSLTTGGGFIAGTAAGIFREWRTPGSRRWRVTVQELELPWLLRPFSGAARASIEQRVEAQSEAFESFQNYDVFISEELAGGQYVLVGLRRDLVDEAITRFGRSVDKQDVSSRRAIARWLFTAPSMQSWIKRPGQPYALKVVTDESGLVHELQVFYERTQVGMKFSYLTVGDKPAWKELLSTFANSNAKGLGRLEGQLKLGFADYKVDLTPRWQDVDRAESENRARESGEGNQAGQSDPTEPSVP